MTDPTLPAVAVAAGILILLLGGMAWVTWVNRRRE